MLFQAGRDHKPDMIFCFRCMDSARHMQHGECQEEGVKVPQEAKCRPCRGVLEGGFATTGRNRRKLRKRPKKVADGVQNSFPDPLENPAFHDHSQADDPPQARKKVLAVDLPSASIVGWKHAP